MYITPKRWSTIFIRMDLWTWRDTPSSRGAQHVVTSSDEKNVIIGAELARNVLIVRVIIRKNCSRSRNVIMVAMGKNGLLRNTFRQRRKGSLIYFHRRLRHINYKAIERLAKDPASGIVLTDRRRPNCTICAQEKQPRYRQSKQDSDEHSPIDQIGGVVCSDCEETNAS